MNATEPSLRRKFAAAKKAAVSRTTAREPAMRRRVSAGKAARTLWSLLAIVTLILVILGLLYRFYLPEVAGRILDVEFAGSSERLEGVLTEGAVITVADVQQALWLDFAFLALYAIGLFWICAIGARYLWGGRPKRIAWIAAAAAVVAAGFDAVENFALLIGLSQEPMPDIWFQIAASAALIKFITLALPVAATVAVIVSLIARLFGKRWRGESSPQPDPLTAGGPPPPPLERQAAEGSRQKRQAWDDNYRIPEQHDLQPPHGPVGVCLSGGGIRSGVFAMGAMQSLAAKPEADKPEADKDVDDKGEKGEADKDDKPDKDEKKSVLDDASFLATVSGGGYFGGALQMLRHLEQPAANGSRSDPIPLDEAFAPGSAEVDHVRRHGKYVAEGPGQWLIVLVTVLRSVVFGLGLVYGTLLVLAWVTAALYAGARPLAWQLFEGPDAPDFAPSVWWALGLPLAISGLLWVLSGGIKPPWRGRWFLLAAGFLALTGIVAVVVLVIPGLVWVLKSLTGWTGDGGTVVQVGTLTALATVASMLWNMLGMQPGAEPTAEVGKLRAGLTKVAFATRFLTTLVVLAVLVALGAVVYGAELSRALESRLAGSWDNLTPALVAAGIILLLVWAFDQTRMSLHPFYKKRLATAFAIKRHRRGVREIDYSTVTKLSEYGKPLDAQGNYDKGGMRLLVCAAAHTSGQELGVPGRRVVPFVFSSDAIGSPQLGYLDTEALEGAAEGTSYCTDITQTAAMALSGAAFASAMGNQSTAFDTVLSLTNARLGAWLPNPRYHHFRQRDSELHEEDPKQNGDDGQSPERARLPPLENTRNAFPKRRRLQYFAKEVFGAYSPDDRFVYVTDGGHYENLGLIELLRRRCTLIYCVDASGDSSLAYALAEAAALAYEELGVTISIDGVQLSVNSAQEGEEPNEELRKLHQRLAPRNVVTGTFRYPGDPEDPPQPGTLIIGKCRLAEPATGRDEPPTAQDEAGPTTDEGEGEAEPATEECKDKLATGKDESPSVTGAVTPFPLLAYAANHPEFPNDPTSDQWFDAAQFEAYLALGREVGARMADPKLRPYSSSGQRPPGPADPGEPGQAAADRTEASKSGAEQLHRAIPDRTREA